MRYLSFFISACIITSAAFAGGVASLVGQKSVSKGYAYDPIVESDFVDDCSKDANRDVCQCVINKIKQQYSEKEYLKIDKDLQNGIQHTDFVTYVTEATNTCDKERAPSKDSLNEIAPTSQATDQKKSAKGMTEAEAKEYATNLVKKISTNNYIDKCSKSTSTLLGKTAGQKACSCAYNNITKDMDRLTKYVMVHDTTDSLFGAEYVAECYPNKYTPEIRRNFINILNQGGTPKSTAQCLLKAIEKEYTLRNFLTAMLTNKEEIYLILLRLSIKCEAK